MHGNFVWYELMTTDAPAAAAFYGPVVGWSAVDAGPLHPGYTILQAGGAPAGGLFSMPDEHRANGMKPHWAGYIAVDNVEDYARRVSAAGGAIHRGPADIPEVGRFAVAGDPQGAVFVLFEPKSAGQPPAPGAIGHGGWRELHADDWEAAFGFYAGLFGWTKGTAVDMGPLGTYQLFAIDGVEMGGMLNRGAATPRPGWLYYFNVAGIGAAADRVTDAGGQIVSGPMEVPGGSWIVHGLDPQGAMFALVSQTR